MKLIAIAIASSLVVAGAAAVPVHNALAEQADIVDAPSWAENSILFYCIGRSGIPFGVLTASGSPSDKLVRECIGHLRQDYKYYANHDK